MVRAPPFARIRHGAGRFRVRGSPRREGAALCPALERLLQIEQVQPLAEWLMDPEGAGALRKLLAYAKAQVDAVTAEEQKGLKRKKIGRAEHSRTDFV